jgi:hypothetical protein
MPLIAYVLRPRLVTLNVNWVAVRLPVCYGGNDGGERHTDSFVAGKAYVFHKSLWRI